MGFACWACWSVMLSTDTGRLLDNPVWSCLTTRHAHLALGGQFARRYPADVSPIAGVPGLSHATITALEEVVAIGDDVGIPGPFVPVLPDNWQTLYESRVTQMIRAASSLLPEGDVEISALGPGDVAEMLALVDLTRPGPFRPRTIELGRYIGVRERGRLVAMGGERMWVDHCREVSAVCTHPDAQGQGYARALAARVVNRMLRGGEIPFLHVEGQNRRAIDLYESLGFARRTEFPLFVAKRIG